MKQLLFSALFFLILPAAKAQSSINVQLKHELDSILVVDQQFREYLSTPLDSIRIDSISKAFNIPKTNISGGLINLMNKTDSTNMIRIEAILKQYGYPGKTIVGEKANEAAFYVVQHSKKVDVYLPLIEKAARAGELPFYLFAMMKDRSLMYNNQPQIWGSQAKGMNVTNNATGKAEWKFFVWPIEDPTNVNKRRKQAGFEQTVEDNAKRLGLEYKVLTMEDVKTGKVN
jgi:hypothetical protein